MPASTSSAKRVFQSALVFLGMTLALAALAWTFKAQSRAADVSLNEVSMLAEPSPFRVALIGHLDQIHIGLVAYGQNPDPELVERIEESGKAFEHSLKEFGKQSPQFFPVKAQETLLIMYRPFAGSVTQALSISRRRAESRAAWQGDFEEFLQVIQMRLRPLSRKDREGAAVRNDALLNLENQWRAWQQSLAQYWAEPVPAAWSQVQQSQDKIDNYLSFYDRVAPMAAERKQIQVMQGIYEENVKRTQDIRSYSKIVDEVYAQTEALRQQLVSQLTRTLPALPPEELDRKKTSLFRSVRWRTAAMGGCVLGGLLVAVVCLIGITRLWKRNPENVDGVIRAESASFEMNLKGEIIGWTFAATSLYGYDAEDVQGQSIALLFASEEEITHFYEKLKSGKQTGFDARHKTKAGALLNVWIEFQPIKKAGAAAIRLNCRTR